MLSIIIGVISLLSAIFVNIGIDRSFSYIIFNFLTIFSLNFIIFHIISLFFAFNKKVLIYYTLILTYISFLLFYLQLIHGFIINPSVLNSIIHQEKGEALSIMSIKSYVLLFTIPFLFTVPVIRAKNKITFKTNKTYFYFICCLIFIALSSTLGSRSLLSSIRIQYIQNTLFSSPLNFIASTAYLVTDSFDKNTVNNSEIKVSRNKIDNENLNIYFIIGESARFDRFSLNGYSKKTNPLLEKEKNLINFKKINTSCDICTNLSTPCMLSGSQQGTNYDLFKIFNNAGFHNKIFSPNSSNVFKKIMPSMFKNSEVYLKYFVSDYEILDIIKNNNKNIGNNFIIIQMRGSHDIGVEKALSIGLNYDRVFKPYCKSSNLSECYKNQGKDIADNSYDNTILFTDFILHSVIDKIRDQKSILFFASDHGELIGEDGYFIHAITKPDGTKPQKQYEIPIFIWMSDKYIANNPEKYKKILKRSEKSTNHIELYKSIIACNNIEVEGLDLSGNYCE